MLPGTADAVIKQYNEVTALVELPVLLGRNRKGRLREVKLLA